ncbi:LysR family transcriptional regulator [Roseiarcaceae bacterium H3SJ34-1]|uniref:LysR family transcriptional regulator n=1 Tax=Terripilifer ovatus TaxID=3032367 RepID=UPI003AB95AFE|nr:LysR family transcriptional regulator [Roseiarcaceae bacterium H3SJ34-1]
MDRFKSIESFVLATRSGSFASAAKTLRLSRAMVSRRITDLEDHLGVRLLHRTTRQLVLTSAGQHYLRVCEGIIEHLKAEESALDSFQSQPRGLIRITTVRSFGQLHMSAAIAQFVIVHPEVQIEMVLATSSQAPINLTELGFDLGISIGEPTNRDSVRKKIAKFSWMMCASPDYVKRKGMPNNPRELDQHICINNPRHSPRAVWSLRKASERLMQPVHCGISITSSLGCREAALRGVGIAFLPSYLLVEELKSGKLVPVLPDWSGETGAVYAIYPHYHLVPKKVKLLTRYLEQHFRSAFDLTAVPTKHGHRSRRAHETG